jgi:Fur family ferric uptake transcriptional regulator
MSSHHPRPRLEELEKKCQAVGLKLTEPRRLILQVLTQSDDHPSVEQVYDRARKEDPKVAMATTYRTLNLFHEFGIVTRIDLKEGFSRFELNWGHHHHLIDVETGDVHEFQNEKIEQLKNEIAAAMGYDLVECVLELYGRKRKAS